MKRAPPGAKAVARRAIALKHLAAFALSMPRRDALVASTGSWTEEQHRDFRADARLALEQRRSELGRWLSCFTAREKAVYRCTAEDLSVQDHIDASWRIEGVHVLAWALRAEARLLPYDRQASLKKYSDFATGDLAIFVHRARLRPRREIEAARDLAEFWHWRSRTRELHEGSRPFRPDERDMARGIRSYDDIARYAVAAARRRGELRASQVLDGDLKAKGKAYRDLTSEEWSEVRSITVERHFTLNWLCGYAPRNSWEKTPTDT